MRRGEIWLVNFDPALGSEIKKTRPAVILSGEPFNRLRRTVIVVPLSGAHEKTEFPLLVAIRSSGKPSVAVVDQIKAAAKERLIRKLGVASADEVDQITDALAKLVGGGLSALPPRMRWALYVVIDAVVSGVVLEEAFQIGPRTSPAPGRRFAELARRPTCPKAA
jgi:mRNA interferase MazF